MLAARKTSNIGTSGFQQHRSRGTCLCLTHKRGSVHRSSSGTTPEAVKDASGEPWAVHITPGLSWLLAGSVIVNTLAAPLLAPLPAVSSVPDKLSTPVGQLSPRPQFDVAEAPGVHAEAEVNEQQQWWQQDQQVWQEITSAAELNAYLTSNQPPPAWPALDSTSLSPKLRLVEFYAAWCPACKAAAPGMAEVAGDPCLRQHCSFARVNIDRVKPLVRQLGITKIPTVLLLGPNGTTLDSFRASGQAARDAITQQLAAIQQQQQPSLPPLLPGGADGGEPAGQLPPSQVTEDNGSSSNGAASAAPGSNGSAGSGSDGAGSTAAAGNGSNNGTSDMSAAACGVVPDPSACGQLPPGIALPSNSGPQGISTDQQPSTTPSAAAGGADGTAGTDGSPAASTSTTANPSSSSSQGPVDEVLQAAKQQFLQQHGSSYGYGGWLEQHYQQEIGYRLGPGKHYLDYTGAALYPASLLEAVYKDLLTQTYGNPHSAAAPHAAAVASAGNNGATNGSSSSSGTGPAGAPGAVATPPAAASEAVMEAAAAAVLEHLHADPADYQVVFTRSATDALRMVGEMFPWTVSRSAVDSTASRSSTAAVPSELEMLGAALSLQQQPSQQPAYATGPQEAVGTSDSSSGSSSSSMPKSQFVYTRSNHNSVLGIGAYAAAAGAELVPVTDEGFKLWLSQQQQQEQQSWTNGPAYSLLAYPAEDNYAGVVYPLSWINRVHAAASPTQRTLVLLDAAAYLPTHDLDLTTHPADFVAASFYKMFGYPTGLGVLVLRTEHVPLLNKVYFGGGSVALATPEGCWHVSKCDPAAALSDGTPNYLGAAALKLAYESWDSRGGMQAVQAHTEALSQWLYSQLSSLHHSNGAPLVQLYGRHGQQQQQGQRAGGPGGDSGFSQGGVFNFQVLAADGQPVSFSRVDREATAAGLYLRSGCVCNPGACYDALGLQATEVQALAGLKEGCGDEMDFATVMRPPQDKRGAAASPSLRASWWPWQKGASTSSEQQQQQSVQQDQEGGQGDLVPTQVPLGSVRASLGWASTFEDVYALVQFLRGYVT